MKNNLRVSLVQVDLHWHEPSANRSMLAEKMLSLKGKTDIIVLPEMFTSGFTRHPESVADPDNTMTWMKAQASSLNAAIVGSLAYTTGVDDGGKPIYLNRLFFVSPEGEVTSYDKVHLFRMAGEHERYRPGKERCVITYMGWRFLATVCYDLRFPVFCRNQNDYDVMLCVANWPSARRQHWRALLHARAIENQTYVVGVNRIGKDGNGLVYSGDSLAIDPKGEHLFDGGDAGEYVHTVIFNREHQQAYRESFPVWQDADDFTLVPNDQ